jgi:hypothetical protein
MPKTLLSMAIPVRIQHPLARLQGTIRRYVGIEGALAAGLFITVWFWLDLAFDYGSFKLAAFDWVQELPRWFRGLLLAALSGSIALLAVILVIRRLVVDFHADALALVLEKRFPDQLGDRLITAVELYDLDRAEAQGYSRAMIVDTVHEAGNRVAAVPVRNAFDWSRLKRLGRWLIGFAVVPFVLTGVVYSAIRQTNPLTDYLPRFREVAGLWAKRNLLLQDVIWPRKAYLEVLDFPVSGEMRVGRDAASPRLRIRARRWMIADSAAPDGWRPMVWTDLRPGLLGGPPPELPVAWLDPGVVSTRATAARVAALVGAQGFIPALPLELQPGMEPPPWTLDALELALDDEATCQRLEQHQPGVIATLRQVFATLGERVIESGHRGLYRRLEVPDRVEIRYWGEQTSSRMELLRGAGWEYGGSLADLKESVKFWARGADFYTTTRSIVLVPPPALQQLKKIEYRPAYLYHRPPLGSPPDGGPTALKGLRQKVEDLVGLNGLTSRITVPAGTDLVLEGILDKELASVMLKPRGKASDGDALRETRLDVTADRLGFRYRFASINGGLDFELEFTDTDGVKSTRHVLVESIRDPAPTVNVAIDGIRRTNQGHYLATPIALIPFEGKVTDGPPGTLGGLEQVDYQLSVTRLEAASIVATQAGYVAGAVLPAIGGKSDSILTNVVATALTGQLVQATAPTSMERTFALETFQQLIRDRSVNDVTRAELLRRLENKPADVPLVREFSLQPRFEGLDLRDRMRDLKVTGDLDVQPRYRMKLTVTATDNNIETGPGVAANKEPPFAVLIVSESELLVEIARDEEAQHVKTEDAVSRLREVRIKLDKVADELPSAADNQLATFSQRAQEMTESTGKARDLMQEVLTEYNRILRELELNRVSAKFIEKVKGEICLPLESCLKGEFVAAEESQETYRKELEAGRRPDVPTTDQAKQRLERLIAKLYEIMAAMGEVTTLNKLIANLREIEKGQEQIIAIRLKELQRRQREKLIRDLDKLKGIEDK